MAVKTHLSTTSLRPALNSRELRAACEQARKWRREQLVALAIARGCRHYAPGWRGSDKPVGQLPHEILGAALLRGPEDEDTFSAIRCGAMVLSDLQNDPAVIVAAADELAVTERLAHIAKIGLEVDDHPDFWREILAGLPVEAGSESTFLPGVSRFVSETGRTGSGRGAVRTWLRTAWTG